MDYFLFLIISYPQTFHEVFSCPCPRRSIHAATSIFTQTNTKKKPTIYAIKSGLAITIIPKSNERSQKIGIIYNLEKARYIQSSNIYREYHKEDESKCMKELFKLEEFFYSFMIVTNNDRVESCCNNTSTIKCWDREEIDDSKIDGYERYDNKDESGWSRYLNQSDEGCTDSDRTSEHIFGIFTFLWSIRSKYPMDKIFEEDKCQYTRIIRLICACLDSRKQWELDTEIWIDSEILESDVYTNLAILRRNLYYSMPTILVEYEVKPLISLGRFNKLIWMNYMESVDREKYLS